MRRVVVLPTLLTLGNLLSGFAAIVRAFGAFTDSGVNLERLEQAAMLCFLAMVFDVLDGSVARFTRSASRFGTELDSLADLISFGVAPAVIVMVFLRWRGVVPHYAAVLVSAYVAFGALRLARYNVEAAPGRRREPEERGLPAWYFAGLPIPAAAGTVVSFIIFMAHVYENFGWVVGGKPWYVSGLEAGVPFMMLLLGLLMVTRVPYIHLTKYLLARRRPFTYLVAILVAAVLLFLYHEVLLFAAFAWYVGWGGLAEAFRRVPRRAKAGETVDDEAT